MPFLVSFLLTLIALPLPSHTADLTGTPRIIDGDTIVIDGERIRLEGIDAPETKQTCKRADGSDYRCGEMATFALAEIIETHWVTCKGESRDRYKRRIATCFAGPHDINAEMVRRGWALAYRRYSMDYVGEEEDAHSRSAGVWQGIFEEPWVWRKRK